ncbi:branched-chain amino acid ABC transporter ATP-binding protein/permease [Spiractinospora alimapuensis]|uniref:branched-chain amino acid ABC transporter ATP-binding protein/permease n=1 Tax=Spiractinospora alimapuensis TaxID=2820884 RepID=UPI001F31D510|nr:branched-chain amino acid ABC transporter ATP-binding protein/permease [Spiractinospora alimapuensis]QVQ53733.1 branched-chain amino acid ABC transporter ATP-binding protein/permease [Spiractinospora alimapuensis]
MTQPPSGVGLLRRRRSDLIGAVLLLAAMGGLPFVATGGVVNVAVYAAIFALGALGLSLLMGLAGQVSLGQAAFFAMGAYTQAILVVRYDFSVIPAAVISVCLAMTAALLIGLPLLRLRGHYLALATLGLGIIVAVVANETPWLGATTGIYGVPKMELFGYRFASAVDYFWLLAPVLTLGVLMARNIVESRVGRALRGVNDSWIAAETLGVDTYRLRLQVLVVAAGYAGLAGVFYAHWLAVVNPSAANFELSVKFLLVAVLGGLGTMWGAIVGGFAVEAIDESLRSVIPRLISGAEGEVQLIGFGIVLTLVMIFLPGGLHQAWQSGIGWLRSRRSGGEGSGGAARALPASAADDGESAVNDDRSGRENAPAVSVIPDRDVAYPERGSRLLEVRDLTRTFGGVTAVHGVSLDVNAGEILGLIGPNGAGKTTMFNMISGVLQPTSGSVTLRGRRIDGRKPHVFARMRATRTFQNLQVFASMTVLGNVMVGRYLRGSRGLLSAATVIPALAEERRIEADARRFVDLVGLGESADVRAGDLPFGRQRLMEVARALASEPDLLMLDEPMAGLSGAERRQLAALLRALRATGMSIVLVEHDVEAVLALADRVAVLDDGALIALDSPAEVREDPAVIAAYLGVDDDTEAAELASEMASSGHLATAEDTVTGGEVEHDSDR